MKKFITSIVILSFIAAMATSCASANEMRGAQCRSAQKTVHAPRSMFR